jgi:hypothetical protein
VSAREKAKSLIELAANKGATVEERQTAAIQACALIRKNDLLASPIDALDGLFDKDDVDAATELARSVKKAFTRVNQRRRR